MFSSCYYFATFDNISIRYGVWPCRKEKRRGSVVLLGGRRDFMEKYAETIGELRQRGFDVYSFDWRGQGLSTRLIKDRLKGYVKNYADYIKDLELFIRKIVKPQAVYPLIILALSMGGHIALRFIHDYPGVIDRAVLVSPMFDILTPPFPRPVARLIIRIAAKAGLDQNYAIGSGYYSFLDEKFEGNRLTSDPERFMDEKKAIAENPDLALGGVTYGWLAATLESIKILKKTRYAENIKTPILIVNAGSDRIVSEKVQRAVCSAMPDCRFTSIPNARHEILKETDSVRSIFWDEFDRFTA